jgi:hypothetical protein
MAHKATHRQTDSSSAKAPVVLFGVDDNGKPKAARFIDKHADLATKAAEHLKLQILRITDPHIADLAGRLPAGRIHANGRGFVPFIRRGLYAKLAAAAGTPAQGNATSAQTEANNGSAGNPSNPKSGAPGKPRNWDEIAPGHVVIAQDTPTDGWYETIVVDRDGDMLTLRWRDYPRERRFRLHRLRVALLFPNGDGSSAGMKPKENSSATRKPAKTAAADHSVLKEEGVFPTTWQEIDIGRLVLAKEDGPWRSWWEAIPTEKTGHTFTLRWRDFPQLPTVVRNRFDLALLCPHTK